jgi:hypothetical protein
MKRLTDALLPLLGALLACLGGCVHSDPHAFLPPSSAAVSQDFSDIKASALAAQHGDKKASQQLIDALSKAQNDLNIYDKKVDAQATLLSKVSDQANYWHAKQTKALKELWMWRAIALFSILAVVGYIGIKTSWRFLL